jgi:hypothetical protein
LIKSGTLWRRIIDNSIYEKNTNPEVTGLNKTIEEFEFKQCVSILKSTGKKAKNLKDLRKTIALVSDDSIFHHTYQYFLKEHIVEYTNDFAHWAGESLEERHLAEQLSNIDPYEFSKIEDLRKTLLDVIDSYLEVFPEPRDALPKDEFFFNETKTLVFSIGVTAANLAEFLMAIKFVDAASIYYHFYEARIRIRNGVDDFSKWISDSLGKDALAERIRVIDLFMHDIEGIRQHIADEVESEVRIDMQTARKNHD